MRNVRLSLQINALESSGAISRLSVEPTTNYSEISSVSLFMADVENRIETDKRMKFQGS
jgi:hypothetical protein